METTIMGYIGYVLGLYWGNIGISGLGFKILGFGFRGAPAHECYWEGRLPEDAIQESCHIQYSPFATHVFRGAEDRCLEPSLNAFSAAVASRTYTTFASAKQD